MTNYGNKSAIKRRLEEEQRWGEFVKRRESLKKKGFAPSDAWFLAAVLLPPLDGSDPEVKMTEDFQRLLKEARKKGFDVEPPKFPTYANGLPNYRGEPEPSEQFDALVDDIKQIPKLSAKNWDDLFGMVPADRNTMKIADRMQWIYDHAGDKPEEIDPKSVPSRGALKHLRMIASNDGAYQNFVNNIYAKLMPDKKYVNEGEQKKANELTESYFEDIEREIDEEWERIEAEESAT